MRKILILATDPAVTAMLKEKLFYFNFDVKELNSAERLFQDIHEFEPDLLVTDFILGDSNGGSICHQIKCDPETSKMPVIILSEYPEFVTLKFGCNATVSKPVDLSDLLAKINECLPEDDDAPFTAPKTRSQVKGKTHQLHH